MYEIYEYQPNHVVLTLLGSNDKIIATYEELEQYKQMELII